MILTKGLLKLFGRAMVLGALLLVFGRCGSSDDDTPANISALFLDTETTTLAAKGYATDPRLVLTGPVGTAYTVTVTEGGSWCWTSRRTQATTKSAQLVAASEVIYPTWTKTKRALRAGLRSMSFSTADTNSR